MKKLFLAVLIVSTCLIVACVGMQVKKDIPGLLEVEGSELYPLKHFTGYTIEQIETWTALEEGGLGDDGGKGIVKGRLYIYRIFENPENPSLGALVIYMAEPERAERVGLMMIHPFMGPQIVAVLDRYKNSDQWYLFDVEEWDRQYPDTSPDPTRFGRGL